MKIRDPKLSLASQFVLTSLPILLLATSAVGWWVGEEVKASVLRRVGGSTSLYVDGFLAPHVQSLGAAPALSTGDTQALHRVMERPALRTRVLALKIWHPDGTVLFSSEGHGVGKRHAIDQGLAAATGGDTWSYISERTAAERLAHGQPESARVVETYTPLRQADTGSVLAVAESYQATHELDSEAARAQQRSWGIVAAVMGAMYGLMFVLVRRGSRTIESQRGALAMQVAELTALQLQNERLHDRAVRAARQAMLVNENQLRDIAANMHDGPVQDLGLALMTLGADPSPRERPGGAPELLPDIDRARARAAVQSALTDLRAICADLDLPEIAERTLAEVAGRALRDFQAKTGRVIPLQTHGDAAPDVALRIKVALYRLLQEALANAHRHAPGAACGVSLRMTPAELVLEVSDEGPGISASAGAPAAGRMGLRGMHHRVALLHGDLKLHTPPGGGASLHVRLPMTSDTDRVTALPEPGDE